MKEKHTLVGQICVLSDRNKRLLQLEVFYFCLVRNHFRGSRFPQWFVLSSALQCQLPSQLIFVLSNGQTCTFPLKKTFFLRSNPVPVYLGLVRYESWTWVPLKWKGLMEDDLPLNAEHREENVPMSDTLKHACLKL